MIAPGQPVFGAIGRLFGDDGDLARLLPGFRHRTQQQQMAEAVARAIEARSVLVAEAGTGTGKTYAYLAPALLCGGRTIVSTGTRNLQDQLFAKDIPNLARALGQPVSIALLKGRGNYICLHRLSRAEAEPGLLPPRERSHLARVRASLFRGGAGDRSDVDDVPEDALVWPHVTSTRDNCLGQDCPSLRDCYLVEARRRALAADLVVVNHHLFFADLALKGEGFGELLPSFDTVIFDEAHQLGDVATLFFSQVVSAGQLSDLARDLHGHATLFDVDAAAIAEAAHGLVAGVQRLREAGGGGGRLAAPSLMERAGFRSVLTELDSLLDALAGALEVRAEADEDLKRCQERAVELRDRLRMWAGTEGDWVRWADLSRAPVLYSSPASVAEHLGPCLQAPGRACILTSATLAVAGDFSHVCRELGLDGPQTLEVGSPFDYPRQGMVYYPPGLPEPNSPGYTAAVVDAILPVLHASGGRAFLLFTSLSAMRRASELLEQANARLAEPFSLLLQNSLPKPELLRRFHLLPRPVLVASQSFWEGVDVPGDALSVVVIDRMPFTPPDDPLLTARSERVRSEGGQPFFTLQLPQSVISLKQGAGRLIRGESDRGVLVMCDPRLFSKGYGRTVRAALPPLTPTRELAAVQAFLGRPAPASEQP